MEARPPLSHPGQQAFASTHWTTVRACGGNDTVAQHAREQLCRDYWYPLYAHIRRTGRHNNDAADLTQDFFAHILRSSWFSHADQSKGKFRSFLLTSLNNFLRDQYDRKKAKKRGVEFRYVPLDMADAEVRYARSVPANTDPARFYEIEWAQALVSTALKRLEDEYAAGGRQAYFTHLKIFLTTDGGIVPYEAAAQALGTTVANVKACVHRLRKAYGGTLREEVARTVASTDEVDCEMQNLRTILVEV